jgi:hypothetical protein
MNSGLNSGLDFDFKEIFGNDIKYNTSYLLNCSIFTNLVLIHTELVNHPEVEKHADKIILLNGFFELYNKFNKYDFCKTHFDNKFEQDQDQEYNQLIKDATLFDLYCAFYDKLNLLIIEFMDVVDYNPNRVSFNHRTSIFLIAYASRLKELWELFNEDRMKEIEELFSLDKKIYRDEFMIRKLKIVPHPSAKGAWTVRPNVG